MKGRATALALGLAVPAGAQTVPPAPVDRVAELTASYHARTAIVRPCPTGPSDEIVVCGGRSNQRRYRLPLPEEAKDPEGSHVRPGEVPRASAVPVKQGSCGVVQGTKNCNRGVVVIEQRF